MRIKKNVGNQVIKKIVEKVVATVHPVKIILFGSRARGDAQEESDIDIIVIEDHVENKGKEMVRLRNLIGNVGVGVDVLVYSTQEIEEKGHLPGSALFSALKEGKIVYESC